MTDRGVLGVGDSIINGRQAAMLGVPGRSWAAWLADSMGEDVTLHSVGGSTSAAVVESQLPRIKGSYKVAAVTVGANDVLYGWDATRFEANLRAILARLSDVAPVVIASNLPDNFRQLPGLRSTFAPRLREANEITARCVREAGALLLDMRDMTGPRHAHPDLVHPTALGMLEMGDRAARLVGVPPPSERVAGLHNGNLPGRLRWRLRAKSAQLAAKENVKRAIRR